MIFLIGGKSVLRWRPRVTVCHPSSASSFRDIYVLRLYKKWTNAISRRSARVLFAKAVLAIRMCQILTRHYESEDKDKLMRRIMPAYM
jgi:hypothetical protein